MAKEPEATVLALDGREVSRHPSRQALFLASGASSRSSMSCATSCRWRRERSPEFAIARSCSSVSWTAPRASRSIRSAHRQAGRPGCGRPPSPFRRGARRKRWSSTMRPGLAWVVNLGCIELHPHPVRAGDLDHPDELRIDLDPTPGVPWADVRRVAMEVKAFLEEIGLRGWPKTSGSRGMHVNVRIRPAMDVHRGQAGRAGACRGRSSGGCRGSPPPSGGRRSVGESFSTTTRMPRTERPARPIRCGRFPMRACRRRSDGKRSPTATRPISPC